MAEIDHAAKQLIDAGKYVVWAGPREINRSEALASDHAFFNNLLKG